MGQAAGLTALRFTWMHMEQTEEHRAQEKRPGLGSLGGAGRRLLRMVWCLALQIRAFYSCMLYYYKNMFPGAKVIA